MPSTVNGIGTSYVGKSNLTQREGECHSCHRHTVLTSYDTRLCFVFFFIPIIPLGRKRIVDQCSICTWHYSMGADQYEKMSTESIEEGMQQFKDDPTAETALGVHGRLIAFQKFKEAKEFREKALQFFGSDAEFMTEMAAQLDEMDRSEELIPVLDRILLSDPDNKMIRARQAVLLSQKGELDRARPLLDYLEKPGAFVDSSPAPLIHLAEMFSKQGRHDDALKMLEHMLRELPKLGKEPAFRRLVLGIEKNAGRGTSLVPAPKNSLLGLLNPLNEDIDPARRRAVWIAVGVVAVLAILAGMNYSISQGRLIHIVNGFKHDLQVSIDGGPAIRLPPGRTETVIREGKHKAKFTGGFVEEFDFEMRAGYFERFFRKPAWILVPGEGAVINKMNIVYAKQNPEPTTNELLIGDRLIYVPHCDYAFVDPPRSIKIKRNSRVKKVALTLPRLSLDQVADILFQYNRETSLRFLERHLTDDPSNETLGQIYMYLGSQEKQGKRVASFLRRGLDERPIAIGWHRNWSNLMESTGQLQEAFDYYDKAIKTEGESAPLLYLHSRVDPDAQRSLESVTAAKKLDPKLGWVWYAEGTAALSSGDFASAKANLEKATSLGVPPEAADDLIFVARLGLGESAVLASELQKTLMDHPDQIGQLTTALIVGGSPDKARQEFEIWCGLPAVKEAFGPEYVNSMREQLMFRLGDVTGFTNALKQSKAGNTGYDPYRSEYLMVTGRANDAEVHPPDEAMWLAETFGLKLALAFDIEGNPDRSKAWAEKVAETWATQSGPERKGAEYLRATEAPPFDQFVATRINFADKALLAAIIARRFPDDGQPFAELARKLTISHEPGSLIIATALESK